MAVVGVGQDGVDAGVVVVAAVQVERGCAAEVGAGRCLVVVVGAWLSFLPAGAADDDAPGDYAAWTPGGRKIVEPCKCTLRAERRGAARGSRDTAGLALLLDGAEVAHAGVGAS